MNVMIFAAGFGTRMRPLTLDRPKPLIEVNGRALIDYAIDLARAADPEVIVANAHYKAKQIECHLRSTDVRVVVEHDRILDTGGGLRNALPLLGREPVVTINPDAGWSGPNPVKLALRHWQPDRMDGLLVCVPVPDAVGYDGMGDFHLAESGMLRRGPGCVYGGVQILKTEDLDSLPDAVFSLNAVWDMMIARQRLFGIAYPGSWCDVGRPEGIGQAERMIGTRDV